MKRLLCCVALVLLVAATAMTAEKKMVPRFNKITKTWDTYPFYSIHDIQFVSQDSLLKADTLGDVNAQWKLQASRFSYPPETTGPDSVIVTVGIVVCPQYVITYTEGGLTMLLHDTTNHSSNSWGGLLLRYPPSPPDTAQWITDGYSSVEKGDLIMVTGKVSEFPATSMNSTTQFAPVPGISVTVLAHNVTIPPPTQLDITQLNRGAYNLTTPFAKPYSIAEQYECSLVQLTGLTVTNYLNSGRQILMDGGSGNQLTDYDWSYYWTIGNAGGPGDPNFHQPPIGAVIDTIRGTLGSTSGAENIDGYRVIPLYPGDVVYGVTLPYVSTHRRNPVIVTPTDSVRVEVSAIAEAGGYPLYKNVIEKSINYGPWTADTLVLDSTSTVNPDSGFYGAYILDQDNNPWPAGTNVRYFFKGIDIRGNEGIYANPSGTLGRDTTKGFFFYNVLNGQIRIHDIQYTPYVNGYSPFNGAAATVSGIITADTVIMRATPLTSTLTGVGTNAWYMQDGSGAWNGIWVIAADSTAAAQLGLSRLGDSVVVHGRILENVNVTTIFDSTATIVTHNRPVPAPVTVTTGTLGTRGNGDPVAEQWEGCLIRAINAVVTDTFPYFDAPEEFSIDDGTGPMRVRRDGWMTYSNHAADTTNNDFVLHLGDRVDTLIGVVYFSYGAYKITPRSNADVTAGEPYPYQHGWNIVSVSRNQLPMSTGFNKSVLFPGAVSQAFAYSAGYTPASALSPDRGYWLKFPNDVIIRQLGLKRTNDTIAVAAGWNLVGSIGDTIPVSGVTALPGGNGISQFFGYQSGYVVASRLYPARGYWVKANQAGSIVLKSSGILPKANPNAVDLSQFNSLTITDKNGGRQTLLFGPDATGKFPFESFELPPPAPERGLDARFSTGRIVEAYPAAMTSNAQYPVVISSAQGPLKVSWTIASQNGMKFSISDGASGKFFKATTLTGSGEFTVSKTIPSLVLNVGGSSPLPREFSLSRNYPNPFNPTTNFEVGVAQKAHLQVVIYNTLGQKVATLVDEERGAGFYTVTWNGLTGNGVAAASGVYFARMNASPTSGAKPFVGLQKIVLLK